MNLNLAKYSKLLKVLAIIPILIGLITFLEAFLPYKNIETSVVSKDKSYRAKFDRTTYNIYFENNNDQFTEEIFNNLKVGDDVILKASYFHEETSEITKVTSNKIFSNSTGEVYIVYLLALVFLLPGLSWFKKRSLSSKQSMYVLAIILVSLGDLYRLLK
ncbi:MAG: hypothetical protein ABJK28_04425 [Algibacter sp.]